MAGDADREEKWFAYLLDPAKLSVDIEAGVPFSDLESLLFDLLSNLLNNQTNGFFTDNPQELWFSRQEERKCAVLRHLCLRLAAYSGWSLARLERLLPAPLLLYLLTILVQVQPGQEEGASLATTALHAELELGALAQPGPTLHSLVLLHRWVVRTFMLIRTPLRTERCSTVMVPGVRRDPAVIYRDQTHTLVSAVAPTSIKFLQAVLEAEAGPAAVPSHNSFPVSVAALQPGCLALSAWQQDSLLPADATLSLALVAHDLGCCYTFCEAQSCNVDGNIETVTMLTRYNQFSLEDLCPCAFSYPCYLLSMFCDCHSGLYKRQALL